ncbi:transcription initiation factor IIB [Coemansia spiralis]|uniref:Transcription initiation factor IIB n=2 Tax=Coemansia TaxID=4863 RepID=A0A9W8KZF9_9FUNG|nr:transcription initiation factor IIB [Coemansia umbellata]KAJ2623284.1 transcription initiation factor IIB [Coemansia sp. RSA 1358]KAJ2678836.1 transcription initiation factor IIB [Coemansia spiralis]
MAATMVALAAATVAAGPLTAICPDCRNTTPNLIHDFESGDLICADCNSVVGDRLISSRSIQQKQHIDGARLLMSSAAISAQSTATNSPYDSGSGSDGSTASISTKRNATLAKALQSRSRSSKRSSQTVAQRHEQHLERAYSRISEMCANMDVSQSISESARSLYGRVVEKNYQRGKSTDAIVATCIFLACRQQAVPRTFKEICALTQVPRKDIGRTFKYLKEKLGEDAGIMSSDNLLARFCSTLSLQTSAQECAMVLNQATKQHDTLAGKSPVSIASACIYMASHLVGEPRDARVISHVAGISEVTIKNSYKLLYADRQLLVSEQMLALYPWLSVEMLPIP